MISRFTPLLCLICVLLSSCQMPKSGEPAPIAQSETTKDQPLPEQAGQCHILNKPSQFFRFTNQDASGEIKFSIKPEANIDTKQQVLDLIDSDQIIDIQRQLQVANKLYQQVLKLPSPLSQPRYRQAQYINIMVESGKTAYGVTYDEVVTNQQLGLSNCFVSMKLSNHIAAATNPTPAHELFHVYQNSVMMFKQAWLSEGLARWSESIIEKDKAITKTTVLPQNRAELLEVMSQSYGASKMWSRLFELVDSNSDFDIPAPLTKVTYVSGEPVIKDNKAYGTRFISLLFDELAKASLQVSVQNGWDSYNWREKQQKSEALNPQIWQAIKQAVNKAVPPDGQPDELRQFLAIDL